MEVLRKGKERRNQEMKGGLKSMAAWIDSVCWDKRGKDGARQEKNEG